MERCGRKWNPGEETDLLAVPLGKIGTFPGPNCPPREIPSYKFTKKILERGDYGAIFTYVTRGVTAIYKC